MWGSCKGLLQLNTHFTEDDVVVVLLHVQARGTLGKCTTMIG